MATHVEDPKKVELIEEGRKLKRQQLKSKSKFEFLKNVSVKHFQAEYVKAQAEEICRYLKEIELTPLNPWYSSLYSMISEGQFMSKFYLTFNEFNVVVPDYDRINTLILPDPTPDDYPRSSFSDI